MTAQEIMKKLAKLGNESTKKTHMRHGAHEPLFGVKVEDLKKIQKEIKKDYALALELYDTGNSDAMYLAGLIADESKMSKKDLQNWAKKAYWSWLSEYAVPWVASESKFGHELAKEWIDSKHENIACSGWCTLSSLMAIKPDDELNITELEQLMGRISKQIHEAPNRVRYAMNGFVIAAGVYVAALTQKAMEVARQIGKVSVDMNGTSCKVPAAVEYIEKVKKMKRIGKKRKMARC